MPTAVKKLRGNPGKRSLPQDEPQPAKGAPVAPPHLSVRGRARWVEVTAQLEAMGTLTTADGAMIALECDAWADYVEQRGVLAKEGWTYEAEIGVGLVMLKPHPAVALMAAAWERVRKADIELGLTPAARSRVKVEPPVKKDPLEELWARGPRRVPQSVVGKGGTNG